ncbi:MAG TPA: ATP-binding protein [Ilumatobacter sp.]
MTDTHHHNGRSGATGSCECAMTTHVPKLIAITGGPGAGKTAVLEIARRSLYPHVVVLPEAAGIVFGGGFPRGTSVAARRGAQRAIFHVQSQLEQVLLDEQRVAIGLCDRGTVDSVAYWPEPVAELWRDVHSDETTELAKYTAVIHLRTPSDAMGYDHSNPLRTEPVHDALHLDALIDDAWARHPNRHIVDSHLSFVDKAAHALALIHGELPECCRNHATA